jgi:hypothetical protein
MKATTAMRLVLLIAVATGAVACKRREPQVAPAPASATTLPADSSGTRVGDALREKIDRAEQASRDVAKAAHETREKIDEATAEGRKELSETGVEVGKKVERAGEKIEQAARQK